MDSKFEWVEKLFFLILNSHEIVRPSIKREIA